MKKLLLTTLAISAMTTSAFAGSLNLDARVDYNSTTFDADTASADAPSFSKFYFKTGRLDYAGKLNDEVSFRVRWAYTKDQVPSLRDATPKGIELAYLTHKMSDLFSISFGKYNTEFGGFEGATSGADLYLTSEFYTQKGANSRNLDGTTLGTTDLLYMTGAKAAFTFEGQTVFLMAADAEKDVTIGGELAQNYGLMGLVYKGAFMEKALQFMASYHILNASEDDKNNFYAVGVKWDSAPIMASLDYLMSEHETTAKDTVTSIVGKLAYTGFENWIPRLEVISSEEKREIGTAETNKFMSYGAVVEYVPKKEDTFRYHIAYNTTTEDHETLGDISRQEIVVGTRLLADFLK
ncbi:porin [Bdellovibrio sp. HCB2-146]|uniref:porin n=1 Tax=Bdellovibrio sp. HCB2-146 TaxID=3394362 RepID=UPI0039BC8328